MGTRENSWNTAETPSLRAFRTVKTVTGSPAISIEPLVGADGAGEDRNQSGFARAVLAEQHMNLARFEGEVHMVERNDARITLGEAARFDNRFLKIGHDRRMKGRRPKGRRPRGMSVLS